MRKKEDEENKAKVQRSAKQKRKTEAPEHNDTIPTINKSDLRKIRIKPFPKSFAVAVSIKPNTAKENSLSVIREKPKEKSKPPELPKAPREDSFFKDFDASKLDFSRYDEKKQPKGALELQSDQNSILDKEVLNRLTTGQTETAGV